MADQPVGDLANVQAANFVSAYANNVQFQSTTLDLKLVFGEYDQSTTPPVIRQHTAITVTWAEAKLAAYFLLINLAIHESEHGKVGMPAQMVPKPFTLPDEIGATPAGKAALERTKRLHDELLASI